MIWFGETIIHDTSNQQKSITLNSTKAEYIAFSDAIKTAAWLRQLVVELWVQGKSKTIFQENHDTIELETGGSAKTSPRYKDIDLRPKHVIN